MIWILVELALRKMPLLLLELVPCSKTALKTPPIMPLDIFVVTISFIFFIFFYFLKFWLFIHCRVQDPYTSQCTVFPDSLVGYTSACCKLKCRIWYNSGGNVCLLNNRALQTRDQFSVEYWARLQTHKLIRINAVVKRYTVEPR